MRISVIGTGYVGLVAGACFSDLGNEVICVDIDAAKINLLNSGKIPIYEPGLEELVSKNMKAGRLSFSTDLADAVKKSEIVFIAVGTPSGEDGSADLTHVINAAKQIAESMNSYKIIVNKSTVPVGTAEMVKAEIAKKTKAPFSVVSNPEFLREGSAIRDFMEPDRVVIGSDDMAAAEKIKALHEPLGCEILVVDAKSAELIKYASNTFLAVKISFINEIANLCEKTGADIEMVAKGMGLDSRIGKHFLKAGAGYGGSCFPKDVKAIISIAKNYNLDLLVASSAHKVNERQKLIVAQKVERLLGSLKGKRVAVLGLAFKPNTDDMREASSIVAINYFLSKGAHVIAYDPVASRNAKKIMPKIDYATSAFDAIKGADAIVLLTEWDEFKEIDLSKAKSLMKGNVLVDGRNVYDPKAAKNAGFIYEGIGRKPL